MLVSSPPLFGLNARSQQTSFLEEAVGRGLSLHSRISENSLFLLPLTKRWSVPHLPLTWHNVVRQAGRTSRGRRATRRRSAGCCPADPRADSSRTSPSVTNLRCVALLFQIFDNEAKDLEREVCFIDIACDEIPERYYKESEVSNRWDGVWKRFVHSFIQQMFLRPC